MREVRQGASCGKDVLIAIAADERYNGGTAG